MSKIQNQKVSMAEKVGYGLGDCSANLVFQMMMIYQTKFCTDVFGLEGCNCRNRNVGSTYCRCVCSIPLSVFV